MNNKYLAIVLSIAAVIVVVYQVFLRKDTKEIHQQLNQPPQQEGPMFSAAGRPDQPANRGTAKPHVSKSTKKSTGSEKKEEGLIIDYNSAVLLKRINPELALPYTPRELPPEFGTKIFSGGAAVEDKPKGPQYEREVEFKLNSINIDEKRAIADINGKRLRVGDVVQGAEVIAIIKGQVVLQINNKKFVLSTNSRIKKIKLMGGRSEK